MIHVILQPEPANFDTKVRRPGRQWLEEKGISFDQTPPEASKLPTYWRNMQKELWEAYQGVCAYLCIYFPWPLGAQSTDHFVAKSRHAGQAYEWANYRLSCLGMNRNKNRFNDILDPFELLPNTFVLDFATGEIKPNPEFPDLRERALATIKRLRLDDEETNRMRAEQYGYYCSGDVSSAFLQRYSPFVYAEMSRQSLL